MKPNRPSRLPTRPRYIPDPAAPGYWTYQGLHISAEPETHQFVVDYAADHIDLSVNVLDIAAGSGALTKQFLDLGYPTSCTSWNGRCKLPVPTYALDLDYPFTSSEVGDLQYGLVCAVEIIEHLENPIGFLRSCRSILAPGGILILTTPNVESAAARLQWLVHGVPTIFDTPEIQNNRHISMLWGQGVEHMIESVGLRVVRREFHGTFPRPVSRVAQILKSFAYVLIHRFAAGHTHGTSRTYVLTAGDENRQCGPEAVY